MANITIQCDDATFTFNYGDYATNGQVPYKMGSYDKQSVKSIELAADESFVKFDNIYLSWAAPTTYQIVDTVDGIEPSSQYDLYNLLVQCKLTEQVVNYVSSTDMTLEGNGWYQFTGNTATWDLLPVMGNEGKTYRIKNRGTGGLIIDGDMYETSPINNFVIPAGGSYTLHNDGTYWVIKN